MKKFFLVLTMVLCMSGAAFAGEIALLDATRSGMDVVSEKLEQGNLTLGMSCAINKLHFYDAETPMGNFSVLYTPELYFGGAYGAPQLPVITRIIQIPAGASCKVVVKSYDSKIYNLADYGVSSKIFPRQPSAPKDGSEVPFVYEKSAYVYKGFHGQPLATIEEIGMMRHMRLAHLTISPVTYNAVDNKINVYNNIELEIVMENADIAASKAQHASYAVPAFAFADSMVTVPQALRFGASRAKEGYVIVSDPMFKDAIAPFAAWKQSQGFVVKTVYTDQFGTGPAITEPLKAYLHGLYNNPTADMPAPSYVLFVGDHAQIPAFKGQTGSHITELYYVAVTGGDFLPEMLTGRFSAQNIEQLLPQIEKTMEYGQYKFPDPSFLDNVVLVAGWDATWARSHGWPHINYAEKYYINKANGFNVYKSLSAGSQQNSAQIVAEIAKGVGYVNYTAHGSQSSWADPSMSIAQIKNLGNKGKYPFVIGNCCLTSKFEVSECFAEAWLRAKDAGAIGYVGGTNSTYWDEDFHWGVGLHSIVKPNNEGVPPLKEKTGPGVFEAMFEGNGTSNAGFMVAGNLAVEASSSSRKQYYWEVYHLMGDPSLKTYMGQK
ncbi:MAG TPA: hypothetical protein DCG57_18005 [Candidatus Riflebacteria bacterium]|nr:hypothetical protein [Candidatus Riflebacteria bacterium]